MFNIMSSWIEATRFGRDINDVVAMRMMRLASGGPLAATEARRMVLEKVVALGEANVTIMTAMATGRSLSAASKKNYARYRSRVRANRRRIRA
jgi:hypothetical protein